MLASLIADVAGESASCDTTSASPSTTSEALTPARHPPASEVLPACAPRAGDWRLASEYKECDPAPAPKEAVPEPQAAVDMVLVDKAWLEPAQVLSAPQPDAACKGRGGGGGGGGGWRRQGRSRAGGVPMQCNVGCVVAEGGGA